MKYNTIRHPQRWIQELINKLVLKITNLSASSWGNTFVLAASFGVTT